MEYKRKDPGYRPRDERLKDYKAVERQLSYDEIHRQAARCMDCGTPFCHAYGCPVANVIPEFNYFVCRGNWQEALNILLSANNFPEFTGRVCPAPCEAACVAGINWDPVTIRQIELAVIERGFESGYLQTRLPGNRYDERVAIIGSGPAGLAVADTLNRAGYRITVYDDARYPGGILRYGIPDFKLEKWAVDRRISLMEEEGVVFETGITVAEDISYRYLTRHFNAVCLACGAREPRELNVPGRDLKGIYFAMDYLTQQNKRVSGEISDSSEAITAKGKTVVVIGGGDTGSDCLGTALRQGAKKVYQLEILPKPPADRSESTPWPMWPLMLRQTHAHEEGGELLWSVMTKEFSGEDGILKKLLCAEVEWVATEEGKPLVPVEKAGTDFEVEADMVLLAMGFLGPGKNRLIEELGIALDSLGNVKVDERHMTNIEGLFVAGDMTRGQSLVVRAIGDGRKAARGITAYLNKAR
jgi:glutamate synthase (NADPH/NADH) small chain